jgi:hypothetical protein
MAGTRVPRAASLAHQWRAGSRVSKVLQVNRASGFDRDLAGVGGVLVWNIGIGLTLQVNMV